jgi:hypothetical protein
VRRFPLWDQLHPVFGDRTASRPLATGYNGQDDGSAVLFDGEDDEDEGTTRATQESEAEEGGTELGSKKVGGGKAVGRGKKRPFGEVLVDLARDREDARSKRATQMLEYMKNRHDEKTKVEKSVAKTALINSLKDAGFSKEEIQEHIKDI